MINNKIKQYIQSGKLTFILCLLSAIIIPLHVDFLPPVMILWLIAWIIENHKDFNKIWNIKNPAVLLFAGFTLYFLWYLAGLIYTEDFHNGTLLTFRRLPFVVFPLVLVAPGEYLKKNIMLVLRIFALSTLLYILFSFGLALIRSTFFTTGTITFNPRPPDADYENYFFGTRFAFSQHPTYLAMYVVFSIFVALESFFDKTLKNFQRLLWIGSSGILLVSLYFLSSRAGILSALLLVPLYLIIQFKKIKKWWVSVLILIVAIPLLIFSFSKNDRMKSFFPEKADTSFMEKIMLDNRVPIWKSTFSVIKHNLFIGVGPGDASHDLRKEYLKEGYTEAYYNNLNAHNQYLEILLGTGLIGFLIIVYILGLVIYQAIVKRNLLFMLFIMAILIFFLFESILNRIAGVTFFSLMTFLLLISGEGSDKELRTE
jgi:O-antigen ligase